MKTKKLTKRQMWFEEAFFWEASGRRIPTDGLSLSAVSLYSRDREPPVEKLYTDHDFAGRCFIRVQYCLERAGIPAGEP